jgi:hypothetical protein
MRKRRLFIYLSNADRCPESLSMSWPAQNLKSDRVDASRRESCHYQGYAASLETNPRNY